MKTITVPTAAVLLVSLAQVVLGGPPGKERGKELAALEQKLVGFRKARMDARDTSCSVRTGPTS